MKYGIQLIFNNEEALKSALRVLVDDLNYCLIPTERPNNPRFASTRPGFQTIHFDAPETDKLNLEKTISYKFNEKAVNAVIFHLYRVDLT